MEHKHSKRFLSLFLAILIVMSIVPIGSFRVSAYTSSEKKEVLQEMKEILYGGTGGYGMTCDFDGYKTLKARDGSGKLARHEGIDFQFKMGENNIHKVYSLIDGEIIGTGGSCNRIAIYDQEYDKTVIYLHVKSLNVSKGDFVKKGDYLAKESNSGTEAIHTHIEVVKGRGFEKSSLGNSILENEDPYPYWIEKMSEEKHKTINTSNDKISASQIPIPVVKKQGTPFEFFQGTVSANTGMAFTAAIVYDSTGKAVKSKSKYHGKTKPTSITASEAFDSLIDFSTLPSGEYTLKLYATCKRSLNNSIISDLLAIINGNMLLVYDGSFTVSNSGVRSIAKVSSRSASYSRIKTDKYGNTYMVYSGQFTESSHYDSTSSYPTGTYKITAKSGLNTRSKPTANSTKLSGWSYGTNVNVTATDGNWGYTSRGWICLDYAEFVSGSTSSYNSNVNYDTGNYVVTTSAGLNCRRGAGTNYGVIKALPRGTKFSVTHTDGAWGYSPEYGGWLCLQYASYESALTPSLPVPELPKLSLTVPKDIAVNEFISIKWNAVENADTYDIRLINSSTGAIVKEVKDLTITAYSFKLSTAGKYKVSVVAKNIQQSSQTAYTDIVTAHDPVTVIFVDWNGNKLNQQTVAYGYSATLPASPSRIGHTFKSWSGKYKQVTQDSTVTATYTRNSYTVTFFDFDGTIVEKQTVLYGDSAKEPDYSAPTGYSFLKWDRDFSNITQNTSIKAIVSWTSIYPLEISTKSAVQRNNKSYIVTSIVNNSPNAVSNAKVIAVLKTKENKLLATVESDSITLAKGEVKNLTLSASYEGMATNAELFVVKADNERIPLASQLSVSVDQGTAWSAWSTSSPPANALQTQSRIEYRYREKDFSSVTTTSTDSSNPDWTLYNTDVDYTDYGSVQGPVYYDPGSSDLRKSWSEQYVSGYNTTKHYYYFRYANSSGTSGNDIKTGSFTNYQELDLTYKLTNRSSTKGGSGTYGWKVFYNGSDYNDSNSGNYRTYWYKSEADVTDTNKPIYGTRWYYQDRQYLYTYYYWQWKAWSSWGTTKYTGNDNRQVETRTTYRYLANTKNNIETTDGISRTIKGVVNTSYANRQALLFIASKDGTSQFVGQTKIGTDGSYSFTFKLKDEPTVASGDYSVTLSIEGTTAAFALDPILAPIPTYKVKFIDYDGSIVSEQTVKKDEDATAPAPLSREGYNFIGWDKSFTNIQANITLTAQYEIKTFDVVFVDEINNTSVSVKYNYGETLVPPEVTLNDAYNFLGWDAVIDGNTKVTDNMVVTAKFKKKIFTVDFLDFDGSVLESQKIEYGEPAVFPELNSRDNYMFISWNSPGDTTYVTESMTIQPYFEYKDTVATPTASIETGTYNGEQTVTLSCETKGAQIYYTTDGSDPLEEVTNARARSVQRNGTLYTGPFTLDSSSQLLFTAVKDGMNSSDYNYKTLAINTANTEKKQYTVTIHYGVFDAENTVLVNDGEPVELLEEEFYGSGYTLEGVYTDAEYKNVWNLETDTVKGEMDLYLKWSKNNYTVTFKDMNGNVIDTQEVAFGEDATAPMWNEVDGYIFTGWDKSYTSVVEDIIVTATYIPKTDVTAVEFNKDSLSLTEGQVETISATVKLGTDCTNNALIWQSSDEDIAIVDDNGKVTAVSAGTATIFAVSEDSGMSAQCEVKVEYKDPCLNGNHTYKQETVEPTCTNDGSVITKCSLCGDIKDTEVIPATGHSDADKDRKCDTCGEQLADVSNCSCNCHKKGFAGFIYKIMRFFWKIFRINKVCACGQAHY